MPAPKTFVAPIAIVATAALVAAGLYLSRSEPAQQQVEVAPLKVDVAKVVKQSLSVNVKSQGNVSPRTQTQLVAEVSGQVVAVSDNFKAGGFFKAGDELLRIDDRNYRADLERARASVASAQSQLAIEQGRADVAYQDWLKFSANKKRSAEADALAQRKPQLQDARARLRAAEADLQRAEDNLARTRIVAPYTGMVRNKQVDIGQFVATGSPLGTTFAVDKVEVRLPIPADRLDYLQLPGPNTKAEDYPDVTLSASIGGRQQQWPAKLVRTEGVFDERSRVLFAIAEVIDPYGLDSDVQTTPLRVGSFVEASIGGKLLDNLVTVPRHILRTGKQLWVVDASNRLRNREVSLLRSEGGLAYVYSGLEEGEKISLAPVPYALPGTEISPNKEWLTSRLSESGLIKSSVGLGAIAAEQRRQAAKVN